MKNNVKYTMIRIRLQQRNVISIVFSAFKCDIHSWCIYKKGSINSALKFILNI